MAAAQLRADQQQASEPERAERTGLTAAARRHLWSVVSHAHQLLRDQGIQFFRSLRAVRRASRRPYQRRSAVIRDALEQEHAIAQHSGRGDAEYPDQAWPLQGQDRRQGWHADARRARPISEGPSPEGGLLADPGGA